MEGRWVVRKIVSGNVVERSKVWLPAGNRPRHGRVKGTTPAAKRDRNWAMAVRQLARILNCNFSHADLLITMTYAEDKLPADWEAHEADTANCVRRMNYHLRKQGIDLIKTVTVCSEMDGHSGEPVRPHTHVCITGKGIRFENGEWMIGKKTLEDIWGKGAVYAEPLFRQDDYTALAAYLIRQAGKQENRKKYHCSRNMEKPIVTEEEAVTGRQLRAPSGAKVMEQKFDLMEDMNYIRYIRPQAEGRRQKGSDRPQTEGRRPKGE